MLPRNSLMKTKLQLILLFNFVLLAQLFGQGNTAQGITIDAPQLYKKIPVPEKFQTQSDGLTYGGDIRMGDLQNNGEAAFLVYRTATYVDGGAPQPCFIGAFTQGGEPLWQKGSGGLQPNRPGPVAIYDIDADGETEVITFFAENPEATDPFNLQNISVQILNGATGEIERQASPDELTSSAGEGPNWVHQRILITNLSGNATPQEFIIKLGKKIIAFDNQLHVLWTYQNQWDEYANCPAYVPAVGDMDNDGKDEINGGYFVLNAEGKPLWEEKLGKNMDAVVIDYWDNPEKKRAYCSGFGHVMDENGNIILKLGEETVPHGQELRVASFDEKLPGNQMVIRYNGHKPQAMLVHNNGKVISKFTLNDSPNHTGMDAVYWHGTDRAALLYNGGMLWKGDGSLSAKLPGLPEPIGNFRQGWYHCIPANVCGDEREEVVVYNPWEPFVYIYSPSPLHTKAFEKYEATPRQYNVRLID